MSNGASEVQSAQSGSKAKALPRAEGSSAAQRRPAAVLDPPTVITGRPPIASPMASDSTCRILEGRVMPGDRLGHFELVEYTGGGGMGRVYRAIDTRLGRTVALKVLAPEQSTDPDALQRFQNEAQSAARLDHDNIVKVYYVGEDRGLNYIAFEFVEGVNIRTLVERKGPLPLSEAVSYTLQATEALAHADARSVVHRDIKPSNLLITPEGRVKLIDMGLARLRQTDPSSADLTASGVTLGTFDYISPEQARDPRNADIRSDIYSLGCTLFYMLAGQPPFPEGTVLQKLLQHQGDQPPDICEFRRELPEESGRILRKMMAKDPRHRYATAAELVGDLLLLAEQIGLRPMSPTSKIWLAPSPSHESLLRRHLPWLAPTAALICTVILLDRFWSSSAQRDDVLQPPIAGGSDEAVAMLPKTEEARPGTRRGDQSARAEVLAAKTDERSASQPKAAKREADDAPSSPKGEKPSKKPASNHDADSSEPGPTPADPETSGQPDEESPSADAKPKSEEQDAADRTAKSDAKSDASRRSDPSKGETPPEADAAAEKPSPSATAGPRKPETPETNGSGSESKPSGVLVVSEHADADNEYASLAAAYAAAHNGDVIELRYDGPREERPVKVSNLRVTVRAGEGYRPVVVFRPREADPVKYPRSMFLLTAGRLTLNDVAVELDVPRDILADSWSLFETRGGQTVRMEKCSLTIRNASDQLTAYHQDVAFFRARLAPEAEGALAPGGNPSATPLATVDLTDCIARGEAVLLRVEDLQPVHLLWDNGLLATTERLLSATGGQTAAKPDEMLRVELRHLTAAVHGGLCRLTSTPSHPHQLTVHFVCSDCILSGTSGAPLIEQEGSATAENFRQRIVWNGDRNLYEDIDVFWAIRNSDNDGAAAESLDFDAWKTYWGPSRENQPNTNRPAWKTYPEADRPLHAHTPADYTLDGSAADADGTPGLQADRLPPYPAGVSEGGKKKTEDSGRKTDSEGKMDREGTKASPRRGVRPTHLVEPPLALPPARTRAISSVG